MSMTQASVADQLMHEMREILDRYEPVHVGQQIHPIDAFFAHRLLLGRNPDPDHELPRILADTRTFRDYLSDLLDSKEYAATSRFLPPGYFFMTEVEGFRFWFNTSDRQMGVPMALGVYEPSTVRLLRRLIRPGMRVIDIGAQTGFYTCLMGSIVGHEGHVYAVEPMPASHDLLARNVRENGFEQIVSLYRCAASDERSTVEASILSGMCVIGAAEEAERVSIESVCLDDIVDGPIDLVKIDVEGHEPAAIAGMKALIARNKPIILSEVNQYWLRSCSGLSGSRYVELLCSLGYDVYNVDDLERPILGTALQMADLDTIDVIAVPAGKALQVA